MALGHTILFESLEGGGYLEQCDEQVPKGIRKDEDKRGHRRQRQGEQLNPVQKQGQNCSLPWLVTTKTLAFHNFFQLKKNTQLGQ